MQTHCLPPGERWGSLPPPHRDSFDRLLLARAEQEGLMLITADPTVARYLGPVRHSDSS